MKKILIITIIIGCMPFVSRAQQDKNILFSQYMYTGLTFNPAYAGSHDVFSASLVSRYQWVGFDGSPKDVALNLHGPGKNTRTGWGANMMYQTIGLRSTFSLFADYAYRLPLGPGTLSMGLKAGIVSGNLQIDESIATDPLYGQEASDYLLPNFGLGFYYNTERLFAGISVPLILGYKSNNNGSIGVSHDFAMYAYYLTAGFRLNAGENWLITPSAIAHYESSTGMIAEGTLNVLYHEVFGLGVSYRTNKNLIALLSYRIGYQTTFGLAYDFGIGGINDAFSQSSFYNRSSFEIAIQVDLGFKVNRTNPILF